MPVFSLTFLIGLALDYDFFLFERVFEFRSEARQERKREREREPWPGFWAAYVKRNTLQG